MISDRIIQPKQSQRVPKISQFEEKNSTSRPYGCHMKNAPFLNFCSQEGVNNISEDFHLSFAYDVKPDSCEQNKRLATSDYVISDQSGGLPRLGV